MGTLRAVEDVEFELLVWWRGGDCLGRDVGVGVLDSRADAEDRDAHAMEEGDEAG